MAVDYERSEYKANIQKWADINDLCAGTNVQRFLRELNPTDKSKDNIERNKTFKEQAVFYPVSGQSLQGLSGMLFDKDPEILLPAELEYLRENANGDGLGLTQLAQLSTNQVIKLGRDAIYTTFPKIKGKASRADIQAGVRPIMNLISADRIINWKTKNIRGVNTLILVVFKESKTIDDEDGFGEKNIPVLRALKLTAKGFTDTRWVQDKNKKWVMDEDGEVLINGGNSKPLQTIPWSWIGSVNNDSKIDDVTMHDLSQITKAIYRTSSLQEDDIFYAGHSTTWMSNMSEAHIKLLKKHGIYVGSKELLAVPKDGQVGILQANPNSAIRQSMEDKFNYAHQFGAQYLIQPGGAAKTATQQNSEDFVSRSKINIIAKNESKGFWTAITHCAMFLNVQLTNKHTFKLRYEQPNNLTAQDAIAMAQLFGMGLITKNDAVKGTQNLGYVDADKSSAEIINELAEEI